MEKKQDVVHGKHHVELEMDLKNVSTTQLDANGELVVLDANTVSLLLKEIELQNIYTVATNLTASENQKKLSTQENKNVSEDYTTINSE